MSSSKILNLLVCLSLFFCALVCFYYASEYSKKSESFSHLIILALFSIWGGCDWLLKILKNKFD